MTDDSSGLHDGFEQVDGGIEQILKQYGITENEVEDMDTEEVMEHINMVHEDDQTDG